MNYIVLKDSNIASYWTQLYFHLLAVWIKLESIFRIFSLFDDSLVAMVKVSNTEVRLLQPRSLVQSCISQFYMFAESSLWAPIR